MKQNPEWKEINDCSRILIHRHFHPKANSSNSKSKATIKNCCSGKGRSSAGKEGMQKGKGGEGKEAGKGEGRQGWRGQGRKGLFSRKSDLGNHLREGPRKTLIAAL